MDIFGRVYVPRLCSKTSPKIYMSSFRIRCVIKNWSWIFLGEFLYHDCVQKLVQKYAFLVFEYEVWSKPGHGYFWASFCAVIVLKNYHGSPKICMSSFWIRSTNNVLGNDRGRHDKIYITDNLKLLQGTQNSKGAWVFWIQMEIAQVPQKELCSSWSITTDRWHCRRVAKKVEWSGQQRFPFSQPFKFRRSAKIFYRKTYCTLILWRMCWRQNIDT